MASCSGLGTAAGGLDPSRDGEGFGLTPTACSETSGGVSALAPECPSVYVHVLGNDVTGQPRYKCYGKLEASVLGKNKNAVKKASDNCSEKKQGPKIADVATATGATDAGVHDILLDLRVRIKQGRKCADMLAATTAATQDDACVDRRTGHRTLRGR